MLFVSFELLLINVRLYFKIIKYYICAIVEKILLHYNTKKYTIIF